MVSGPESARASTQSGAGSNQSGGGGGDAKVPTEAELGALFDQAMKAQQQQQQQQQHNGDGSNKTITPEEQQKFLSAMKDPEFRSLLNDYMQEISDPKHRAETEQYLSQLESEQRVPEDKELIKPVPGFVVKSKWSDGSQASKVFVNVCSSGKLQPPSSTKVAPSSATGTKGGTSWNLPYSVGPERMEADKGGAPVVTFDVCFHTRTLDMATMQRPFLDMVVKICLDAVEKLMRDSRRAPTGDLSRKFHVLKGVSYKSGDPVTMCLRKPAATNGNDSKRMASTSGKQKASTNGIEAARSNQDEARHEGTKTRDKKTSNASNQHDVIDVVAPEPRSIAGGSKAGNLLEEKDDTEPLLREVATTKKTTAAEVKQEKRKLRFQMIYRGKFELMHHMQAEHDNLVPADRNRPKELVVEVEFPLAKSAKGINLDVSETAVRVGAEDYDELSIPLPYPVIEAKGSAKFDKKKHKLVVTLPVQPPATPAPKSVSIAVEEVEEDEEEEDAQDKEPRRDSSEEPRRPQDATATRTTRPAPKHDEFQMLRETALMVANDPLVMARKASQAARASTEAEASHDDMPPLESCSEDEDEQGDGANSPKEEELVSDRSVTSSAMPPCSAPDDEATANTPAFTMKETPACVSFLIAVPKVSSASVKLSFPSPNLMQVRFTASSSADNAELEIKAYAMVAPLPHAVRPETAEVDVATENMVVILEKTANAPAPPHTSPPSVPASVSSFGLVGPVVRFQNDLLYELD